MTVSSDLISDNASRICILVKVRLVIIGCGIFVCISMIIGKCCGICF